MASGRIRDWRCAPKGDFGHAIVEAKDGIEALASLLKYRPYVNPSRLRWLLQLIRL